MLVIRYKRIVLLLAFLVGGLAGLLYTLVQRHNSATPSIDSMPIARRRVMHSQQSGRRQLDRRLRVPFSIRDGQIGLCYTEGPGGVAGYPPTEAMFYCVPTTEKQFVWCLFEIDHLNKLRGHISINTCKQALAFVRLRTSRETSTNFFSTYHDSFQIEVVERERVTPELTFGNQEEFQLLSTLPNGSDAVVDRKLVKRYKIPIATCRAVQGGFLIKRTLLIENRSSSGESILNLLAITEWVGKDGQYVIKKQQPQPRLLNIPDIYWDIPKNS